MNSQQKDELKEKILFQLKEVGNDITSLVERTKPISPDNAIGRITRMEAISAKSVNEKALANAKARRKGLEVALDNIDDPDYGLCQICEEEIPLGRIMLMPETTVCVKCAQRAAEG